MAELGIRIWFRIIILRVRIPSEVLTNLRLKILYIKKWNIKNIDIELIRKVIKDINNGKCKLSISKKYNIPRSTIKYWIDKGFGNIKKEKIKNYYFLNKNAYSYILGMIWTDVNKLYPYLGEKYYKKKFVDLKK